MPRALFSVYDKTGLVAFAQALHHLGWELIASGGTAQTLATAGLSVLTVESLTKHAEFLDGRVKTLHPAIHGPILARSTSDDQAALTELGYSPIDMVVCNLYPFIETISRPPVELNQAIEQIDIGGVALLRAGAKNFERVLTVCSPDDYSLVLNALSHDGITLDVRRTLAAKVFMLTSQYDGAIYDFLRGVTAASNETMTLRYGENPHQEAWFSSYEPTKILGGEVLGGKVLSYNNMLDLDAAYGAVELFEEPTVVIVKHLTPCGIASADNLAQAFPAALASDPVSAFGGVVAVNRAVDMTLVNALGDLFVEAIAAPAFEEDAEQQLHAKRKNCRLLRMDPLTYINVNEQRSVRGGVLVQSLDFGDPSDTDWRVVSQRQPTPAELVALRFAWRAAQYVKSNAIVLVQQQERLAATVGIGGGLPSRVDAVEQAIRKAGPRAQGSVLASDAFFPFPDGVEAAIAAGITAIVQPGGSVRDEQVITIANQHQVAMVFTGVRHFRH